MLQHRVYHAVNRYADVVDGIVEHGLGLPLGLMRADDPHDAQQRRVEHDSHGEYEALCRRYEFMDGQKKDAELSRNEILEIIRDINALCGKKDQ